MMNIQSTATSATTMGLVKPFGGPSLVRNAADTASGCGVRCGVRNLMSVLETLTECVLMNSLHYHWCGIVQCQSSTYTL